MVKNKPLYGSSREPDHVLLTINGDAKHEMSVTWRTSADVNEGYLLIRKEGQSQYRRVDAERGLFESDIDVSHMWWAHPDGLEPGTRYYYTVGSGENRKGEFSFVTEPENLTKFKFILVSDQQQGEPFDTPDYTVFADLLRDTLKKHPDAAFILTGGDNTDCGQHEQQWNGALRYLEGIAENIPFMMTIGNHDNRGFKDYRNYEGRYYAEPAEFFAKQFKGSYPFNGPKGWETENYAFDYGCCKFAVLGVNAPDEVNEWLVKELESTDKTWKIGTYHFPICYAGSDCQNYDAYPMMRPGMEMLDVLFSGHEHGFARSYPMRNESLFDRPSEGTVFYTLGNSGRNPPGTYSLPKVWHCAWYPHEEKKSMICVAEVDDEVLTLTSVLEDGQVVDRCVIDKTKDRIYPIAKAPIFGKDRTRMLFKGADPGLCASGKFCFREDGVWFAPLGTLIAYAGGLVERFEGGFRASIYGRTAVFKEGSDSAETDRGVLKLPAAVRRGRGDRLYVPADACGAFDMRYAYAERNNFLSFEHESEDKPAPPQP